MHSHDVSWQRLHHNMKLFSPDAINAINDNELSMKYSGCLWYSNIGVNISFTAK